MFTYIEIHRSSDYDFSIIYDSSLFLRSEGRIQYLKNKLKQIGSIFYAICFMAEQGFELVATDNKNWAYFKVSL